MKYLFVDIEWQAIDKERDILKEEIIEIGGRCIDDNDHSERNFFRYVEPENLEKISQETLVFLNIGRGRLYGAYDTKKALIKFINKFNKFDVMVVWSEDTYKLLIENIKKHNLKLPEHRTVYLQNICTVFCNRKIGFENTLERYKINFKKEKLHNSRYDSIYLERLYFKIKKIYRLKSGTKLYMLKNSNTIHGENCRHIKNKTDVVQVNKNDIFTGGVMCKHCIKDKVFKRMNCIGNINYDTYSEFSEENILKLCNMFKFQYNIGEHIIFIRTKMAYWRIVHNGEKIVNIYHENSRRNKYEEGKKRDFNKNFHLQKISVGSLYEALCYIRNHDSKLRSQKKSRIDMLFDQISQERNNRLTLES